MLTHALLCPETGLNSFTSILTRYCKCRSVTWRKNERGFSEPIDGMLFLETVFQSKYQTKLYISQNYGVINLGEDGRKGIF